MARTHKAESKVIKARLDGLRRAARPPQIIKNLQAIDAETETLKLEQLPELLRMIRVLVNLQEIVDVYGIARFFMESPEPLGAYAADELRGVGPLARTGSPPISIERLRCFQAVALPRMARRGYSP